jgi:hypothetical protein
MEFDFPFSLDRFPSKPVLEGYGAGWSAILFVDRRVRLTEHLADILKDPILDKVCRLLVFHD